jgi:hypothetical protein
MKYKIKLPGVGQNPLWDKTARLISQGQKHILWRLILKEILFLAQRIAILNAILLVSNHMLLMSDSQAC